MHVCTICGYLYDPEKGESRQDIKPGTEFERLPEEWVCPRCGAKKYDFKSLRRNSDI